MKCELRNFAVAVIDDRRPHKAETVASRKASQIDGSLPAAMPERWRLADMTVSN